ncbi:MAG: HAD family hydrolase [Lachnospiraceae bacterium]|nr:HAD family hydrolase [Lachnospiraceae bacterium]
MIQALFFDLDGTLLSSRKTLLPSTRDALRKCREEGIRVFLATARSPMLDKMLGWTEEEFALFEGGIYCNGACTKIGESTEYAFIEPAVVRFCLEQVALCKDVHVGMHLQHEVHAFNHFLPDSMLDPWGLNREEITEINESYHHCTVKILIYYDNLVGATKVLPPELFRKLKAQCTDRANIYLTDQDKTIQVVAKDISKLVAIERVRNILGFSPDEVAVFGDDVNDMEMLSHYRNSVAMGNAEDQVKRISSYTTMTNDDDGIAYALKEILHCI